MRKRFLPFCFLPFFLLIPNGTAFVVPSSFASPAAVQQQQQQRQQQQPVLSRLSAWSDKNNNNGENETAKQEEEARLKILAARRRQVRQTLRAAEALRNFRWQKNLVPEIDAATGQPVNDGGGKTAVTVTAFVVAAGAIALRIGGRAALISAAGLNFLTESPELGQNLEKVLTTADAMDPAVKALLFTAGWTAVKVFCFDAGGVVLALAAGILFGGVWQGAVASAAAATFGSSVAFAMAKLETPVRTKALEILEEYPSLRGIEKVVARDGLKAVLTLRLAPVLPIPIGMYNYIYGVTNVPVVDFAGGIFLGSLKPYLLDSYLGYFGKEVVEGKTDPTGMQDILLLVALGISVLVGVFASQLAAETWDSVLDEVEAEKKAKKEKDGNNNEEEEDTDDGIVREFLGWTLPEWMVGFQLSLKAADERMSGIILDEYEAKVWNYTSDKDGAPPPDADPANLVGSPEIEGANQGIDLAASVCDALVLSPLLFGAFLKYADPLYNELEDEMFQNRPQLRQAAVGEAKITKVATREELLKRLDRLRTQTQERIDQLDERINK